MLRRVVGKELGMAGDFYTDPPEGVTGFLF